MLRFTLSALCLLVLGGVAAADVKLQTKALPNTKRVYQIDQKSEQVLTIGPQDVETKTSTFIVQNQNAGPKLPDGSVEIVEKIDVLQNEINLPGGLTFQFDSANPDKKADNPLLEPIAVLLRLTFKNPVTVVMDASGKVSSVRFAEDVASQAGEEFRSMFDPERRKKAANQALSYLPAEAVKVGDTWEFSIEADLGSGQTLTITSKVEYKGTTDVGGKTLHRLVSTPQTVSYAMDPNTKSPLKVLESDLKPTEGAGEYLFDAEAGELYKSESKVRIQGSMKMEAGGQQFPGKLDLTLTGKVARQP
ncbi:MAG: DUF6263 family protein [Planctomycetaceae bacterium]|nr:DUF6263 family protein [Planctomycetaceae bacterium]